MVSQADPRGFKSFHVVLMEEVCVSPGLAWEHPVRLCSPAGSARLALQPLQCCLGHLQGEEVGGRDVPMPRSGSHLPARGEPTSALSSHILGHEISQTQKHEEHKQEKCILLWLGEKDQWREEGKE